MYIKKTSEGYKYWDGQDVSAEEADSRLKKMYGGSETPKVIDKKPVSKYTPLEKIRSKPNPIKQKASGYSIAKMSSGGYLKKYADGGDPSDDGEDYSVIDNPPKQLGKQFGIFGNALGNNKPYEDPTSSKYSDYAGISAPLTDVKTKSGTSDYGKIGKLLKDNEGNIINTAAYLQNKGDINSLKTSYGYSTVTPPKYTYADRSGLARKNLSDAAYTVNKGLTSSSSQGNVANKQATFAKYIGGLNEINNAENQNRDSYDKGYYDRVFNTDVTNVGIANRASEATTQAENEKIKLGVGNRNALLQGIMGNEAEKNKNIYQNKQLDIEKAKSGTTGVYDRGAIRTSLAADDPDLSRFSKSDLKTYYNYTDNLAEKAKLKKAFPELDQ